MIHVPIYIFNRSVTFFKKFIVLSDFIKKNPFYWKVNKNLKTYFCVIYS